jgi:WD40 repeat protein
VYHCRVGKAEFMPPELQGKNLSEVTRTIEQDNFALAILIFQTLMEGSHPFAGIYSGEGEPPTLAARIAVGHFPYSNQSVPYHPSPLAVPFTTLHPKLQEYFLRCFVDSQENPQVRPTAMQWSEALSLAEKELSICKVNTRHVFGSHLHDCPWCYRKALLNRRDPFPRYNWDVKRINEAVADTFRKMDKVVLTFLCLYILMFITIMIDVVVESSKKILISNQVLPTVTAYPTESVRSSPRMVTASSNPYPSSYVSASKHKAISKTVSSFTGNSKASMVRISFCENGNQLSFIGSRNSRFLKDFRGDCLLPHSKISINILKSIWHRYTSVLPCANKCKVAFNANGNSIATDVFWLARNSILSGNALSPNGLYFATMFYNKKEQTVGILLLEAHSGRVLKYIVNTEIKNKTSPSFHALAFSPDSKMLAVAEGYKFVKIFSIDTGKIVSEVRNAGAFINSLKFVENGSLLRISEGINGYSIVNVSTGQVVKEALKPFSGESYTAFSSDDKMSAVIADAHNKIIIQDTLSGKVLKTLAGGNGDTESLYLTFSKDSKKIAVINRKSHNVTVYDLKF